MVSVSTLCLFLLSLLLATPTVSYRGAPYTAYRANRSSPQSRNHPQRASLPPVGTFLRIKRESLTECKLAADNSIIALAAGALSGSIGVGVAYPLDALKTKAQTYASSKDGPAGSGSLGLVGMTKLVFKEEGINGFYGGVLGVMVGQGFVKAVAFASNGWALTQLNSGISSGSAPTITVLCIASGFSGFVTSFLVNPIERVKILMQSDKKGEYQSEIDCAIKIMKKDGFKGLMVRGLDATLAREIPGYGLYFVVYSLLMTSEVGLTLGPNLAPLVCGAAAGCLSWIPVFPFDVVKTNMQNTQGEDSGSEIPEKKSNLWDTAVALQKEFGFRIFFDGISPKLLRAAVNHSVTFFVYDYILRSIPS